MKKLMSLLLVCCILLGVLPFSASAETTLPTSQADSIKVVFWAGHEYYPAEYPVLNVKINATTQTAIFSLPEQDPIHTMHNIVNLPFYKWVCNESDAFGSEITSEGATVTIHNPVPGKTYVFRPWLCGNHNYLIDKSFENYPAHSSSYYYIIPDIDGLVMPKTEYCNILYDDDVNTTEENSQPGDIITVTMAPGEGYILKSIEFKDKNLNPVEYQITPIGNNKYQFKRPDDFFIYIVPIFAKENRDGNDGTITSLQNGYTSTKAQAPQGDVLLTITNDSQDTLANIYIPSVLGDAKDFVDNRSGWYKEAVDKASALKLFNGVSETEFAPNSPMTRAMWVTVLHNLSSHPSYGYGYNFSDVPTGSWYDMPVQWAYSLGITSGTSATTFSPLQNITREQMVTMLYRYAKLIGVDSDNRASLSGFTDSDEISSYAYDAMCWAVAEGFITGMGDGTVDPKGNSTRAQVATVLTKFVEYIAGRDVTDPPAVPLSTQNGYYICPICKYVNKEGTPCRACSTIDQAKPEEYCPTCGGGYDVGGVESWIHCRYCDEDFAGAQGPYYSCSRCHKTGLWPLSLDPDTHICIDCMREEVAGSFGYCETCGVPLIEQETENCAPNRCSNCSVCKYCSAVISTDDYTANGDLLCEMCKRMGDTFYLNTCTECGADISYQGGDWSHINCDHAVAHRYLCWNCWEKEPGKVCAFCGRSFSYEEIASNGNICTCGCDILLPL